MWIELTYSQGDKYHSHCDKVARTSRIAFLCDPNIGGKVGACGGMGVVILI